MPPRNLMIIVLAVVVCLACYRRASRNRYAATIAEAMGRVDDHFVEAVDRALLLYQDSSRWQSMMRRGMRKDFSWSASARQYLDIYNKVSSS